MANFDLTATFMNVTRFLSEGHKFSTFSSDFPKREPAALVSLLTTQFAWTFAHTLSHTAQVYHNPAYTSCLALGNFWFDSPLYEETGCYDTTSFRALYETEHPGEVYLQPFDLYFFRAFGKCIRYKERAYAEALVRPPPPPPKKPVDPVVFHYDNGDPELEEEIERGRSGALGQIPELG